VETWWKVRPVKLPGRKVEISGFNAFFGGVAIEPTCIDIGRLEGWLTT